MHHKGECVLDKLKNELRLNKIHHQWIIPKGLRCFPFPSGSAEIIKFLEEREKILP